MTKKRELKVYIFLAVILTILPLCFYAHLFARNGLSKDTAVWGNFATYFSGLTTPILGILNLIVLVRLTLSISNYDNDRMLTQLRYDAYKDIATKLNGLNKENYTMEKVNTIYYFIENYGLNNFFLLEGDNHRILTNIHLKLWKILCKAKFTLETYEERNDKSKMYNSTEFILKTKEKLTDTFIDYDVTKLEMLSFLEKMILKKPIDNFRRHFLTEEKRYVT